MFNAICSAIKRTEYLLCAFRSVVPISESTRFRTNTLTITLTYTSSDRMGMIYAHLYSPKFSSLAKCYSWPWLVRLRVLLLHRHILVENWKGGLYRAHVMNNVLVCFEKYM